MSAYAEAAADLGGQQAVTGEFVEEAGWDEEEARQDCGEMRLIAGTKSTVSVYLAFVTSHDVAYERRTARRWWE